MTESFAELFAESLKTTDLKSGSILKATIVDKTPEYIVVNAGLKSESYIPLDEFRSQGGKIDANIGDTVDVILETVEDGSGETHLSREKAKRFESWKILEEAFASGATVTGVVTEHVRGGFTVEVNKIRAFLPGSLVDTKPIRDPSQIVGKEFEFKVIKIDKKQNNIVLSRRAALAAETGVERQALLSTLQEGSIITGIVKNLTDYGAFIDLGGVDGLLHITDMSWKRIRHPSEIDKLGDEIKVKVLKFDRDKNRVSLGYKQLEDDPWRDIGRRYPAGSRLFGKVTNITDYGCFVEIEPGIEGLVHMSEMDWTNKNVHPAKLVTVGQEIEVMVLEIDEERRRISLGIKQCKPNPWKEFGDTHNKDDKVMGKIKSITDFGIFIGLDGDIDGLVHLSDISWTEAGEKSIRNYKKGQEVEAVILAIDPDRERISLGIKQLEQDIYSEYVEKYPKGTTVAGVVTEVTPKAAIVDLTGGILGKIKASDVSREHVKNVAEFLKQGDEIEAKVLGIDKKNRLISLSIKELQPELNVEAPANTQLGDLLKEQISNNEAE